MLDVVAYGTCPVRFICEDPYRIFLIYIAEKTPQEQRYGLGRYTHSLFFTTKSRKTLGDKRKAEKNRKKQGVRRWIYSEFLGNSLYMDSEQAIKENQFDDLLESIKKDPLLKQRILNIH